MKLVILIIAVISVLVWPINFLTINQKLNFSPRTIFESDYQGRQLILRNINLYPNIPLARMFQNKANIFINKYFSNFFNLIDPNYYFFGSHPREIPGGQNYIRLPLLTLIPIFWFLYKGRARYKKNIILFLSLTLISLSFFTNFYQFDLIIWPFMAFFVASGLNEMYQKYKLITKLCFILLLAEAFLEIWRSLG